MVEGKGRQGGDNSVLPTQGGDERVRGVVVDVADPDGRGKGVGTGMAGQDGYLKDVREELIEDGGTQGATGLGQSVRVVEIMRDEEHWVDLHRPRRLS